MFRCRLIIFASRLLTRRVPLVEQELLSLSGAPEIIPGFSGVRVTRSLILCVCFGNRCLSFCTFLWAIVLSVLLWYTNSDYPFGISNFFLSIYQYLIWQINNSYWFMVFWIYIALTHDKIYIVWKVTQFDIFKKNEYLFA